MYYVLHIYKLYIYIYIYIYSIYIYNVKKFRNVKKKIMKTIVWSVMLYGAETWILKKKDMKRLNAVEMWLLRRMERISWMEKKTNEAVLSVVREKRKLIDTVVKRKKNWIGHILRGNKLLKEVIEGRIEGKRPRRRPRIGMLEELKEESFAY